MTKKKKIITWGVLLATVASVAIPVSLYLSSNNKNYRSNGEVNFKVLQKFDDSVYHYNPPMIPQHWMNMDYDPVEYDELLEKEFSFVKFYGKEFFEGENFFTFKDKNSSWNFSQKVVEKIGQENLLEFIKTKIEVMNFNGLNNLWLQFGINKYEDAGDYHDNKISINGVGQDFSEVFVHEFGHSLDKADLQLNKGPLNFLNNPNKESRSSCYSNYFSENFKNTFNAIKRKIPLEWNDFGKVSNHFPTMKPWFSTEPRNAIDFSRVLGNFTHDSPAEEFATQSVQPYILSTPDLKGIKKQNYYNALFGDNFWDINDTYLPFKIYGSYLKNMVGCNNWDEIRFKKVKSENNLENVEIYFNSMSKSYAKNLDHIEITVNNNKYNIPVVQKKYRVGFHWAPLSLEENKVKYVATGDFGKISIKDFTLPSEVKYFDENNNEITPTKLYYTKEDDTFYPYSKEEYILKDNQTPEKVDRS